MTSVRPAVTNDWPAIWRFLEPIVRAGDTYTWDVDTSEADARVRWMVLRPWHVVVAEDEGGAVVGTAKFGPNQDGPGAHVANASFMVDPARSGRGIGRQLGEHVLDEARAAGFRSMQFNAVVETNAHAVSLWQSLGFDIVGTIPEAFAHPTLGYVGLHVMYRRL